MPTEFNPLHNRDYTLIVDKSGSMSIRDMPNGKTRWKAAEESTTAIANKVFEYDSEDGIDVWLFSNTYQCYPNVGPEKVRQIFKENEPFGGTQMAEVLQKALDAYFEKRDSGRLKTNGEMILVITDGEPDNEKKVVEVLVNGAKRLRSDDNLAINFIQVGKDESAANFLNYLDEELTQQEGAPCDFVETVNMDKIEEVGFQQVLMNTVYKTLRV